jgi:hypothetical protein
MAAPSAVGSTYEAGFSTVSSVQLTITSGFSSGNSVGALISQQQSTIRTITGIAYSAGSAGFAAVVEKTDGTSQGSTHVWMAETPPALAAGETVTASFSGNTVGRFTVQEFTAVTSASLTDTAETATGANHICGATGLTTSGDVLILAAGVLQNVATTTEPGANYTRLGATLARTLFEYRASAAGLSADQGPWSLTGTNRSSKGCMAAFYDATGGAATSRPIFHQAARFYRRSF